MIKIAKLASGVLFAALALATYGASAQEAGPPLPPLEGMKPQSAPPKRNNDAEISIMTKRYGLSDDQVTKLRTILKEEQDKAEAIFKDTSLSPKDVLTKLKSLKDDETTRVSAILNPEQLKKYQDDVKQMQAPPSQPPSGFPPPPPSAQ
jgi:periplasmic protein CpxP/Spy